MVKKKEKKITLKEQSKQTVGEMYPEVIDDTLMKKFKMGVKNV